jgi:hypothetical protein
MERVKGIEPSPSNPQVAESEQTPSEGDRGYTQIGAQIQGSDGRGLSQVVKAWPDLPPPLKAAILAIVNSAVE